jgi:hypothetical protein
MFDEKSAVAEIEEPNRLRREAQLPPLPLDDELQRLRAAHDEKMFDIFMVGPLREIVESHLLTKMRRKTGDPKWRPTGFLSGGGFAFNVRVRKVMKRLYRHHSLMRECIPWT